MTRIVLRGGRVFDGTGADPADGRRRDRGRPDRRRRHRASTATRRSTSPAGRCCPGLFDCHAHVCTQSSVDLLGHRPAAVLATSSTRRRRTCARRSRSASRRSATPAAPTSGSSRPSSDGLIAGPADADLDRHAQPDRRPRRRLVCRPGHDVPLHGRPSRAARRRSSTGPTRCAARSASCVRMGADVIKVATTRRRAVAARRPAPRPLPAGRARRRSSRRRPRPGIFVMAHAQGADGIKNAVRAGIRSIEHGIYLDDEAIELMLDRGTWLVPTLVAPAGRPRRGRRRRRACRRRSSTRRGWSSRSTARPSGTAVEAGVRIAMGTDSGVTPHGRNLRELRADGRAAG